MSEKARKKICFVIMPFSKTKRSHDEVYWNKHWDFLKEKIEECPGIIAKRSVALRGDILREIIIDLYSADVVVADLTDLNPNVYWELGVRQSWKNGTVTIAEFKYKIAFDMGMKSILRYYPKDSMKNEVFVKNLKKAIIDCIDNPDSIDSRVLETLSGRGSLYQVLNREENSRKLEALMSEIQFNENLYLEYLSYSKSNLKLREEKSKESPRMASRRLVTASLELLSVNRYLDQPTKFYDALQGFLGNLTAIIGVREGWDLGGIVAEQWFIDHEARTVRIFKNMKKAIGTIQKQINVPV